MQVSLDTRFEMLLQASSLALLGGIIDSVKLCSLASSQANEQAGSKASLQSDRHGLAIAGLQSDRKARTYADAAAAAEAAS